jgi:thiol:disulfide interchange protein DsbD
MEAGGPIPTHVRFETGDDVTLEGITLEKGDPQTIHDSLYEMDVTWYTGSVVFEQRIRLINPVTALRGAVEYMTCNDEICIPEQKTFSIPMQP